MTLVVDLCGGENGARDVVDDVARIDDAFKDVAVGAVFHDALEILEHARSIGGGEGSDLALEIQGHAGRDFGLAGQTAGAEVAFLLGQGDLGGNAHLVENLAEHEGGEVAGDNEDVLAVFHIGGDAAGDLLVTVGHDVDENDFRAADSLFGVGGHAHGLTRAVHAAAQCDAAELFDILEAGGEALIVVEGDFKAALGHNGSNGVAGGTGADNGNFTNHNTFSFTL